MRDNQSTGLQRWRMPILVSATLLVAGCGLADGPAHRRALDARSADSMPIQNITSFTEALSCMDGLFETYGKRGFTVTSNGVIDPGGEIGAGTRDMVISAVSRMSRSSRAFRYIDYEVPSGFGASTDLDNVFAKQPQAVQQRLLGQQIIPQFYIRGSITQFDDSILSYNAQAGLNIDEIDGEFGASFDDNFSAFTLDMNIGRVLTREVLPDTTSTNVLAIRNNRIDGNFGSGASIASKTFGPSFSFGYSTAEHPHTAIRNLVELAVIESLGRLTQVPYWRCLSIGQTNPRVQSQVNDWYNAMDENSRVLFVQRTLGRAGYYSGPEDGVMTIGLSDAIGRFQRSQGNTANGRISLELYRALIAGDIAYAELSDGRPEIGLISYTAVGEPNPAAPEIDGKLAFARGKDPLKLLEDEDLLQRGDVVYAAIETFDNTYLYCYYRDASNTIYRIFPNRYEPNALIQPGARTLAPSTQQNDIRILLTEAGVNEEIRCYSSSQDLGLLLPTELKGRDLEPMPVASLEALEGEFIGRATAQISQTVLPIVVSE